MDTRSEVKERPRDGCVCSLAFSAAMGPKACSCTRVYQLENTFDPLSASLMGMRCERVPGCVWS